LHSGFAYIAFGPSLGLLAEKAVICIKGWPLFYIKQEADQIMYRTDKSIEIMQYKEITCAVVIFFELETGTAPALRVVFSNIERRKPGPGNACSAMIQWVRGG
jgi:hypothetical protein